MRPPADRSPLTPSRVPRRSRVATRVRAVTASGLLLFAGAALAQGDGPIIEPAAAPERTLERRLLQATNEARSTHGLAPLAFDPGLADAARAHAAENAARGVLDHGSPDPDRSSVALRVADAGVALVEVGENLARMPGPDVADEAIAGWLASPGHRRNLLSDVYTHVGFGTAPGPDGTYVVQVLGARPLNRTDARAEARIEASVAWEIRVDGEPGQEAMAFLDDRAVEPVLIGPDGRAVLALSVPEGTTPRLDLAVHVEDATYRRSDAIVLDPAGWRRPGTIAPGTTRVADARATPRTRAIVRFELRYVPNGTSLALYADGIHRPDAEIDDGTARWSVSADDVPGELGVAIVEAPGRARLVERFTVVPGDPPSLVPGGPPIVSEEAP